MGHQVLFLNERLQFYSGLFQVTVIPNIVEIYVCDYYSKLLENRC